MKNIRLVPLLDVVSDYSGYLYTQLEIPLCELGPSLREFVSELYSRRNPESILWFAQCHHCEVSYVRRRPCRFD